MLLQVAADEKRSSRAAVRSQDEAWMRLAIALGEGVRGSTGDNPWVGCVIARGSQWLAEGATQPPGQPHAEALAIARARERSISLADVTLYSTVEPCSFEGRTGSCAKLILTTPIPRVVIAVRDPHPRVNGAGVRMMLEAGIEVVEDVCADEARASLAEWLRRYRVS